MPSNKAERFLESAKINQLRLESPKVINDNAVVSAELNCHNVIVADLNKANKRKHVVLYSGQAPIVAEYILSVNHAMEEYENNLEDFHGDADEHIQCLKKIRERFDLESLTYNVYAVFSKKKINIWDMEDNVEISINMDNAIEVSAAILNSYTELTKLVKSKSHNNQN